MIFSLDRYFEVLHPRTITSPNSNETPAHDSRNVSSSCAEIEIKKKNNERRTSVIFHIGGGARKSESKPKPERKKRSVQKKTYAAATQKPAIVLRRPKTLQYEPLPRPTTHYQSSEIYPGRVGYGTYYDIRNITQPEEGLRRMFGVHENTQGRPDGYMHGMQIQLLPRVLSMVDSPREEPGVLPLPTSTGSRNGQPQRQASGENPGLNNTADGIITADNNAEENQYE